MDETVEQDPQQDASIVPNCECTLAVTLQNGGGGPHTALEMRLAQCFGFLSLAQIKCWSKESETKAKLK